MSSSKPAHLRVRQRTAALAAAVAFLLAAPAVALEAGFPPWDKFADVDVIDIVTSDADGSVRETPLWFVMVDGAPYLRTSATRWLANIESLPCAAGTVHRSPTFVVGDGPPATTGQRAVELYHAESGHVPHRV